MEIATPPPPPPTDDPLWIMGLADHGNKHLNDFPFQGCIWEQVKFCCALKVDQPVTGINSDKENQPMTLSLTRLTLCHKAHKAKAE